ncbi:ubiquinone anaerobic biosynthesis accessory factor UbiT [Marinobacter sp. CA1]|uniref:ubiquinone anaerobic biosynthesis accessory factor UbiT n=1 Tax=Marinobacter sp. CA1 TaxID=2817656 RepID=UPI001D08848D|nr:SCP2 sterol-binding domain-containing protein [Marinobacter sp. CA1]UDL05973.1 SCP2 sterol-binding domain-containing protein [Marinobacter sp. CA1]
MFLPHPRQLIRALPPLPGHAHSHADRAAAPTSLGRQLTGVLKAYAPSPAPWLAALDRRVPVPLKQLLLEAPLNRVFTDAISGGEFDEFEGRRIRLECHGGQPGVTLGFWCGRLRVVDGPGEATIRGTLAAFRTLAERQQDPDQLFFQRRLVIEGDTELGLGLKNLLDSLEWQLLPTRPPALTN